MYITTTILADGTRMQVLVSEKWKGVEKAFAKEIRKRKKREGWSKSTKLSRTRQGRTRRGRREDGDRQE
jgi:hypothetical protein